MTEDLDKTQVLPPSGFDDCSTQIAPPAVEGATLMASGGRLENHYPVIEVRGGKGVTGMGVVYIVEDAGKLYAVKTFQRRYARELAFIERFVREARTWMLIGFHPNVVHAYRVEIIDAVPYLFMEYVPGDRDGHLALSDLLRVVRLNVPHVVNFALQFCEGMAHSVRAVPGLVHRDIKPDNILIAPDGTLKITDFGLVRAKGEEDTALAALARLAIETKGKSQLTEIGSVFGTPAYMAPEQFQGAQKAQETSDIYAFGCVLYEMLTGRSPFRADDAPTLERIAALRLMHLEVPPRPVLEHCPHCPAALADLTMRCLSKAPEDRWTSFEELCLTLRELYTQICGEAPTPLAQVDALPKQIAAQMRSIALLDGYMQAIRLKRLRDRHEESPYAFHLALASYFHCQGDAAEERRQLERALEARTAEMGSEAVRRLAELHVQAGQAAEALALIEPFAASGAVAADQVLEPRIHALLAAGRAEEAHALAYALGDSRRGLWLKLTWARATDNAACLRDAGLALLELVLKEIPALMALATPESAAGYGYRADPMVLRAVLAGLRPELVGMLPTGAAVYWPDIGGMPDFSGAMAWLSDACGALGACTALDEETRAMYAATAESLGWPRRMREHLEREEYWFWLQQATAISERCHAGK